jgi:hypothetical protein
LAALSQAQVFLQRHRLKHRGLASIWVTAREAFWIALEALRAHKLRSFLTLLGGLIGTATIIVVNSNIAGLDRRAPQ